MLPHLYSHRQCTHSNFSTCCFLVFDSGHPNGGSGNVLYLYLIPRKHPTIHTVMMTRSYEAERRVESWQVVVPSAEPACCHQPPSGGPSGAETPPHPSPALLGSPAPFSLHLGICPHAGVTDQGRWNGGSNQTLTPTLGSPTGKPWRAAAEGGA